MADRLFLDANVLFSAAWRADAGLSRLWYVEDVHLLTSPSAAGEAHRNLLDAEQATRLEGLMASVTLCSDAILPEALAGRLGIPEKDRPILAAALACGATHLLTCDTRHFGHLFGTTVHGLLILPPGRYLQRGEEPR